MGRGSEAAEITVEGSRWNTADSLLYVGEVPLGSTSGIGVTTNNLTRGIPRSSIWQYTSAEATGAYPPPSHFTPQCLTWAYNIQTPWGDLSRAIQLLAGPYIKNLAKLRAIPALRAIYSVPDSFVGAQKTMALHHLLGVPYVAHVMDSWVETEHHRWGGVIRELFGVYLHRASAVLCISKEMAAHYRAVFGVEARVAANAGIPGEPAPHQPARELLLLYTGSAYGWTQVEPLNRISKAVARLRSEGMPVRFEMILSGGHNVNELRPMEGTSISGRVSYESMAARYAAADVLVAVMGFDTTNSLVRYSMPTKVGDYLGTGRAILVHAPSQSAVAARAAEEGWGFVLSETDDESLASGLRDLLRNVDLQRTLASAGRKQAEALWRHRPVEEALIAACRSS